MEAAGQDVLEEATEELEGLQVDRLPGAGAAVAKGPAQPSMGQELELAVGAEAFGVLRQVLQGLGTGGQEQIVAQAGMSANPTAQAFRHGEGDQEIVHGQQQRGVFIEPLVPWLAFLIFIKRYFRHQLPVPSNP